MEYFPFLPFSQCWGLNYEANRNQCGLFQDAEVPRQGISQNLCSNSGVKCLV